MLLRRWKYCVGDSRCYQRSSYRTWLTCGFEQRRQRRKFQHRLAHLLRTSLWSSRTVEKCRPLDEVLNRVLASVRRLHLVMFNEHQNPDPKTPGSSYLREHADCCYISEFFDWFYFIGIPT